MTVDNTTIVLHNEGTRRALEASLWECVHAVVACDITTEPLYLAGQDIARSCAPSADTEAADQMVEALTLTRRQIDVVRAAQTGTRVSLQIDPATLARGLEFCVYAIEKWEEFWDQPIEQRTETLRTRDAALLLLDHLPKREAVTA